jgi:PAS domain S-box-containing protein
MLSINKILPRLSIRSKLIIAFTGLSVLPVILVGLHGIFSNVTLMENIALENLTHDVQTIRENTANFLGNIESDLRVIHHSSPMKELLQSLAYSPHEGNDPLLQHLSADLQAFAKMKGLYYQLRLVNNEGDELLRIEADDSTGYRIANKTELRHTRESFYFLLIQNLTKDQIAFVPGELVDQKNRRVPVISFAMPLEGVHRRVGILIANVFASNLFRVIESKRHFSMQGTIALVSGDGYYLYHSEKKKDWNKLLASRQEDNLQHDYPSSLVKLFLSGREGNASEGIDEIVSYAPLFSSESSAPADGSVTNFALAYFVIESVPKNIILAPVRSFAWMFAGFLAIFLTAAVGLGLLATRQFTKPIAELRRGAEVISRGAYGHRIHVETHDEIEDLAEQFNAMAASLESHEREIQSHRSRLEEMVKQRTIELSEEKTKLQAILDHIPSAVVVIGKDFKIQSASAALSGITEQPLENVKGKDCSELFNKNGFIRECVCRRAMRSKKVESDVEQITDSHGEERFIEHVAIPMSDNGDVESVLEIITDVTKKKRIEQQLLRTEKLAAAGEISAIIAHEFRNALTSIKMILQLSHESKRLSRPEKQSLAVALDSISHMEQIVNELLDFARPKPMEFRALSLNKIVNDSLALALLHIDKRSMDVMKTFDPELPEMMLDESHLKEALINTFLNAAQAIDTDGVSKIDKAALSTSTGKISVETKRFQLGKTLRDFAFSQETMSDQSDPRGHEVVLKKGSECGLIRIKDNGCGIDPSQLLRIFDPFFTTKPYGTGLGLPMLKRTINAHGGVVTVTSKKNQGTSFNIYLPLDHAT